MFFPCLESSPTPSHLPMPSVTFVTGSTDDTHIPSPCWLTNTQCNFQWVTKPRVTPDSYHSTLGLHDNHDHVFPLLGNRTFRLTPRVSYTHTEILDISTDLLHPLRNSGYLTHTEIMDISMGLLHPHKNSGYLHGSLTPTQKFWISQWVSYTHIGSFGYYCGSPSPNFQVFHLRGLTPPFLLRPTHINYFSFPDLNYESSLDVVPKTNSTHTHPEW